MQIKNKILNCKIDNRRFANIQIDEYDTWRCQDFKRNSNSNFDVIK